MRKVINFATVFFLFSTFVGCAGLKPQMREIHGSESKKFSYTHAELNLEFKVPVKVTEVNREIYRFTGSGMPVILVNVYDQQPTGGMGGYYYYGLDWYAKSMGAMVFDTVKPDGFEWREAILFYKTSATKAGVGYVTRKHNYLLMVGHQKNFTSEEISEIKGLKYKTKAFNAALSELDSWMRIVSPNKENIKPSWKESSEKIKTLGELFEKGLISKEEYETKKNELLNNF